MLAGAFPEEIHGHGVTWAPLGVVMCVSIGALPKQGWAMTHVFLVLGHCWQRCLAHSTVHKKHMRDSFDATEVEAVC